MLIGRAMTKDRETAPWPPFIGELILCAQRKAGASALLCGVETQWVDGGGEHNKLGPTLASSTPTRRRELPYA